MVREELRSYEKLTTASVRFLRKGHNNRICCQPLGSSGLALHLLPVIFQTSGERFWKPTSEVCRRNQNLKVAPSVPIFIFHISSHHYSTFKVLHVSTAKGLNVSCDGWEDFPSGIEQKGQLKPEQGSKHVDWQTLMSDVDIERQETGWWMQKTEAQRMTWGNRWEKHCGGAQSENKKVGETRKRMKESEPFTELIITSQVLHQSLRVARVVQQLMKTYPDS